MEPLVEAETFELPANGAALGELSQAQAGPPVGLRRGLLFRKAQETLRVQSS